MSKRLLIIVNTDWFFHSHRFPLALEAINKGYSVHIATTFTDERYRTAFHDHGLIVHDLFIDRSLTSVFSLPYSFFLILRLLFRVRPDIAHFVTIQPVLLGGLALRFYRIKLAVFAISGLGHAFLTPTISALIRSWLVKLIYKFALGIRNKVVIFQNQSDMRILSKLCGLNSSECFLIPGSGVDLNEYSYSPLPRGTYTVLMASRLLKTKGVEEFFQASQILLSRGFNVNFLLAGSPDPMNPSSISIEDIEKMQHSRGFRVLGHISEISKLMSSCHIVCLPSYYPEGLPRVLCEASACGRPIITTNLPGCRDSIDNGKTGLLIEPRDPYSLANSIEKLISNPDLLNAMSLKSREFAESNFDLANIIDYHLDIYSLCDDYSSL